MGQGSVSRAAWVSAAGLWCASPLGGTRGQYAAVEIARTSETGSESESWMYTGLAAV